MATVYFVHLRNPELVQWIGVVVAVAVGLGLGLELQLDL